MLRARQRGAASPACSPENRAGRLRVSRQSRSASPQNDGIVANAGLIAGRDGAIAIGTGASDRDGERLLRAIARITKKPVVMAINTYAGPEHVMGNIAFARRGIPILAHREMRRNLAAQAIYAKKISLRDASQAVSLPHFQHWAMYDTLHGRNVHQAYLSLEVRELARLA